MRDMERRSFLSATMATFPLAMFGQSGETSARAKLARVAAGVSKVGSVLSVAAAN